MIGCLTETQEGILIDIHVVPGSKKEALSYDDASRRLKVKIRAPAIKGKANKHITQKFKGLFGECEIIRGSLSRKKTIKIPGKSLPEVENILKNQNIFID